MRSELPVLKRCCFCLPLRYGLLTWGYLKLGAAITLSVALIITMITMMHHIQHIVVVSVVLTVLLTDVGLNTVFIVGGHMKNVKLLRIFYVYNIVLWVLTVLVVLVYAVLMMPTAYITSYYLFLYFLDFCSSFVNIIMQTYFLLLLRSEIIKLSGNCEFRFVNNAAEAECTMKYKEGIADGENRTEDICENETEDFCERGTCEKACQRNGICHMGPTNV